VSCICVCTLLRYLSVPSCRVENQHETEASDRGGFGNRSGAFVSCYSGAVIWRVENALRNSQRDVAQMELLGVEVRALGPKRIPALRRSPHQPFSKARRHFRDRCIWQARGDICLCGNGSVEHLYRAGMELPAVQLGQMAVGMLTDSRQPELIIAAGGEGIWHSTGISFGRSDQAG